MPDSFIKDPQAILDYAEDWSDWLGTDTIASVTWTVPDGLTKIAESNTTTTATIWLSGGTLEAIYEVVCHVVTADGREDDRTITFYIDSK